MNKSIVNIYQSRTLKLLTIFEALALSRGGCLLFCWRYKMFGLVTGVNLGQRRPCSGVSLIVLVNNNSLFE